MRAGVAEVSYPRFPPDGTQLAFVGREEGPSEIYVMPAPGGPASRLTFQDASSKVAGWSPDGAEILYASNAGQFAMRFEVIYSINPKGGDARQLPFDLANAIYYGPLTGSV